MKNLLTSLLILSLLAGCSNHVDPVPTGNGGDPAVEQPKLKSVTYYLQDQQGGFRQGEQIRYQYSSKGMLQQEDEYQYDAISNSYRHFSTARYAYEGTQLKVIEKTLVDSGQKKITRYEYTGEKISKIIVDDVVDTEAFIQYLPGDVVEVKYVSSNGRFFTYRFSAASQDITYEQTYDESQQLASESTHVYDHHNNPYRLLGYIDLFFNNYSLNNKVKTTSAYYASAFPQLVPFAYEYQYNDLDYPVQMITSYKSLGSGNTGLSKIVFEYD